MRADAGDGPTELSLKADFVEDTRDKVIKKRRALIALLAEARQEREIAQVAQDFRTDVTLFDEETRQGRVLRQQGGPSGALEQRNGTDNPTPATPNGPELVDPDDGEFLGGGDPSGPPNQPTVTPSAPSGPSPSRTIDPDVLLNMRVEDLAAGALDVSTLQKYVEDLRALEGFLSGQADALRKRADLLEADEARDLQK